FLKKARNGTGFAPGSSAAESVCGCTQRTGFSSNVDYSGCIFSDDGLILLRYVTRLRFRNDAVLHAKDISAIADVERSRYRLSRVGTACDHVV
ncbi:hypothetical protein EVAR_70814_1, partial [Eumeta japonica]